MQRIENNLYNPCNLWNFFCVTYHHHHHRQANQQVNKDMAIIQSVSQSVIIIIKVDTELETKLDTMQQKNKKQQNGMESNIYILSAFFLLLMAMSKNQNFVWFVFFLSEFPDRCHWKLTCITHSHKNCIVVRSVCFAWISCMQQAMN